MNLTEVVKWRYSTKAFDPNKKISPEDFEQVKALLRWSPSSVNLQPWHFIIADSQAGKERIAKGTQGFYHFNTDKVMQASHSIIICCKTDLLQDYMLHLLDQEDKDGRFAEQKFKEMMHQGRNVFADIHRFDLKDLPHWMEKQVYLNFGSLLLGAAALGIDACPMEGIDTKALDEEFELRQKGFTTLAVVSLGYRAKDDFNATLPKSRLPEDEIFTLLD
ncbi:NAD(P)H nitroreductase [marine bacterium AO1-C]|nr:NAD(P)H nitroreductase [marine bacterium AO1-C]